MTLAWDRTWNSNPRDLRCCCFAVFGGSLLRQSCGETEALWGSGWCTDLECDRYCVSPMVYLLVLHNELFFYHFLDLWDVVNYVLLLTLVCYVSIRLNVVSSNLHKTGCLTTLICQSHCAGFQWNFPSRLHKSPQPTLSMHREKHFGRNVLEASWNQFDENVKNKKILTDWFRDILTVCILIMHRDLVWRSVLEWMYRSKWGQSDERVRRFEIRFFKSSPTKGG